MSSTASLVPLQSFECSVLFHSYRNMKFTDKNPLSSPTYKTSELFPRNDKVTRQITNTLPQFGPEGLPYIENPMSCIGTPIIRSTASRRYFHFEKLTLYDPSIKHIVSIYNFDFSLLRYCLLIAQCQDQHFSITAASAPKTRKHSTTPKPSKLGIL